MELTTKIKDIEWAEAPSYGDKNNTLYNHKHQPWGNMTVLHRKTGFGGGTMDTETGFMDENHLFWLASGGFDIRGFPEMTITEAIEHIKENANVCAGVDANVS